MAGIQAIAEDPIAVAGTQGVIIPVGGVIPVGTAGGGIGIILTVIGGVLGIIILVGGGLIRMPIHISIPTLIRMGIPITILISIPILILIHPKCLHRKRP